MTPSTAQRIEPFDPNIGPTKQVLLWLHVAIFTAVNVLLFVINMLVDRSTPWFLYCVWGWGMVLAFQAGLTYRWRGLFGAHAVLTGVMLIGLTGINIVFGGSPWVIWVFVSLGIPLVAHALYAFGAITLYGAHMVASILWFAEIMTTQVMFDNAWWSTLITILTTGSFFVGLLLLLRGLRKNLP